MPHDLLAGAREQAERSKPPVRAPPCFESPGVQTAFDRDQVRHTFEQGWTSSEQLPAATASYFWNRHGCWPRQWHPISCVRSLPPVNGPRQFSSERIGMIMLEHENGDAAFDYVIGHDWL